MRPSWIAVVAPLLVAAPAAAQVFAPIPVTGYTQDVIADGAGAPPGRLSYTSTTASFDFWYSPNYVLYAQGFNPAFPDRGVPADGRIVTSPTRSYQLGPVAGDNSLYLYNDGTAAQLSGTLTLVTPARYSALSLLLADGLGKQPSQGGSPGTLAVHWSDGGSSAYPYTVYDWFLLSGAPGPNSGVAIGGLDRVRRGYDMFGGFENSTTDPRLFYYDIDLTADPHYLAGALVESVTATGSQTPRAAETTDIMGLSGVAAPVPEPSALSLLAAGAGLAACWRRASRRRVA
jgi:hypothetical protein